MWKYGNVIRPLAYAACVTLTLICYFFAILYAMSMEKIQVENWVGAQVVANVIDVTLAPVLIILVKSRVRNRNSNLIRKFSVPISNPGQVACQTLLLDRAEQRPLVLLHF